MIENESPTHTEGDEPRTQNNSINNEKIAKSKQGIPTNGMRVGYHSEAANPSGHSRRLHRKRKNKK